MTDNILSGLLSQTISVQHILQWITLDEANLKTNEFSSFSCSRGEFISHILNFIHEEALCFEKYRETPKKVHTPKSIRKLDVGTKPKRRPALFSDSKTDKFDKTDKCERNYLSPISPLYTRLSTLSVDTSPNTHLTPKSGKTFCLGDFISPSRKLTTPNKTPNQRLSMSTTPQSIEVKKTRRINPTNVSSCSKQLNTDNSFDFKNDSFDTKEQQKTPKTLVILPKPQQKEIPPDFSKVIEVDKQKLQSLTSLYVNLINENRVLNITSELYFILTLFLSKQYESDYFPSPIFASIHHVVYFSVNCLKQMFDFHENNDRNVFNLLDKPTLRLIASNERFLSLDADLVEKFVKLSETNEFTSSFLRLNVDNSTPGEKNVCFDSETDNRENFPSDSSFHAFRKQRDMFYEILTSWELNHASDGWNFAAGLGCKVRGLVGMHLDPANFRHLSRLVKSQLLITCGKLQDESVHENQLTFLTTVQNVNVEKLNRLKSRLVAKDQSRGINAPPTFPGFQEFYKEFIVHAQTHVFCTHFKNVLIQELLQMNETTFETDSSNCDQLIKVNYALVVKSLQLLAKFISFIESMPYKQAQMNLILNDKITLEEVESRAWMAPSIDLHQKLDTAVKSRQLVLLVPWLVEYLAMLDAASLRLPYYEPIFEKLFIIFLRVHDYVSYHNAQLIRCCLGWLFEQQHFPSEHYFHFLNAHNLKNVSLASTEGTMTNCLDGVQIIDLEVLHVICPFLKEFKRLMQYNCNRNGSLTSKHITPVTAIETITSEMNEKRLKLQLEEAFLNSKPSSLRKTLEFVSERIAGCIVKLICNHIVPDVKTKATNEKKELFLEYLSVEHTDGVVKMEIKQKLNKIVDLNLNLLKTNCHSALTKEIDSKIYTAVICMLCTEELQETFAVCTEIASRMCEERVKQWINTRVNTSVFKEFDMTIERIDKALQKERDDSAKQKFKTLPTLGRPVMDHIDSEDEESSARITGIWNPSKLMTYIQRKCAALIKTNCVNSEVEVMDLLRHARNCHKHRSDLSDIAWHQINQLICDYLILLCKCCPNLIPGPVLDEFVAFWKEHKEVFFKDIFNGVVSVRNVVILMTASTDTLQMTWSVYSVILSRLLKEGLFSFEEFESQCLGVFRENWDSVALEKFCQCLQDVVDQHEGKDQFAFLLGFLADYCTDLDF